MSHIVVVGAGQAGQSLVTKLRGEGFDGRITLIGEEPVPPYQRPPLSKKYLLGEIDRAAKTLTVGGEVIAWDQLALTTGAVPRRLPAAIGGDLPGVHVVRSLADVDAMAPEFAPGRRVLIVGGGYIGLEAAAVAARKGLQVVLVEAAERILQRVASAETAAFIRALHLREGVDIREGTGLKRLEGEGRVQAAILDDGDDGTRLVVDFVIIGIGVDPDVRLAKAAGLEIDNGIAVDAQGRSSDPAIWAAGDCASFPWRGGRLRLESVGNAIDMGELVALNMLGAGRPYEAKPWFWSDQYDMKLQIAGLNTGYEQVVSRPGEQPDAASFWYFRGSELLAVDAINDPRAYMVGKRLVEAGRSPAPEAVADPGTDLKALLRG
jgi:3-phenylpropionate/trans-cinnamate dioxygenase ferredoxin reductase subunit